MNDGEAVVQILAENDEIVYAMILSLKYKSHIELYIYIRFFTF